MISPPPGFTRAPKSALGKSYHLKRRDRRSYRYRLNRRAAEVISAIKRHRRLPATLILDVGTADGLVLERVQRELAIPAPIGVDHSHELLKTNSNPHLHLVQADAHCLPFGDNRFDTVMATALLEHVSEPLQVVRECYRVLQPHGLCLVTTPVPFFERIATILGHLEEADHVQTFNLPQLKGIFEGCGFEVVEAAKFMISPIGLPLEATVEKVLQRLGLRCLFLNQFLVGRKLLEGASRG